MFENFDILVCEVFKEAEKQRKILHHDFVGTEHLLLAILKKDNDLVQKLKCFNLNYDLFYNEVKNNLSSSNEVSKVSLYTPLLKKVINNALNNNEKVTNSHLLFHMLDEGEGVAIRLLMGMGIDVDALYNYLKKENNSIEDLEIFKIGKLLNNYIDVNEQVIGRDKEINLIIETLLRKKKNNPLLLGDAGVGKSAIVEQLTRQIIKGDVPSELLDSKIVMLEMGSLIAGTRYRGEFEDRLNTIIKEVIDNRNIILFIDEIHSMVGAGAAEGAISACDILKPYLARGDIKCIGATTKGEYEKSFAEDKALIRRFEPIIINEPTEEETINILKSIKNEYTSYHKVNIKDDVIEVLVHLANTYFPNKRNPDKSIELMDSVMSYIRLKNGNNLIKEKEDEIKKISLAKIKEIEQGNFKEALKKNILENKIKKEMKEIKSGNKVFVSKEDIIDVLEYKNNIIITGNKIKNIECKLKGHYDKHIITNLMKSLNSKYGVKSIVITGDCGKFTDDLSAVLGYEKIIVSKEEDIEKLFNKIKYYPSLLVEFENDEDYALKKLINQILKDNIVEYNNEYYSFNSSLLVIKSKNSNIGFSNNYISEYPIDKILNFDKIKLAN